ncbi:uncharacterized protein Nmag_2190 [Natrialba magadii ATCC 43099]|uniref:Uncharacterized protein n=1 Tax=Natrialba magadii (strain ATCC 43099 / DSM 3394 / CCM 3739 / CIP 104546 / IAM 13178 / JCM 8861 / NBRC 102185 / NCIMB 2190 / MS3) TaxID=547559 RepID=D3SW96_NATMM|nr:hypothetical protein [Natrialba magadii]ADD05757.1 uncharacterized protein Nmag_2190 [Natrialba magadii ATCC 43099]ELY30069.1 hypothetical protein C500_09462 [Natrialba magadii ATCC 43099]
MREIPLRSILRGRSPRVLSLLRVGAVVALVLSSVSLGVSVGIDGPIDRTPAAEVQVTNESVSLESETLTEPVDVHTMSGTPDEQISIARDGDTLAITAESPPINESALEGEPIAPNETHVQEIVRANETVQSLIDNSSDHDLSTQIAVDLSYEGEREPMSVERGQPAFDITTTSENEIRIWQTAPTALDTITATLILQDDGHATTTAVTVDTVNETVTDITATPSERPVAHGDASQ